MNYYNLEKEISTKINTKNAPKEKYEGFLVDGYWVENWKKYSFYDSINAKYLEKNIEDKNTIISHIIKKYEKANLNYDELNNIEKFIIKNIYQIEENKNLDQEFYILNRKFLKSFDTYIRDRIDPTTFYLSYNNIQVNHLSRPILNFKTTNNIISIQNYNTDIELTNQNNLNINNDFNHKNQVNNKFSKKELIDDEKIEKNKDMINLSYNNDIYSNPININNRKDLGKNKNEINEKIQNKPEYTENNENNKNIENCNKQYYIVSKKLSELILRNKINLENLDNNLGNYSIKQGGNFVNFDFQNYQIKFNYIKNKNEKLYYPININIIDK